MTAINERAPKDARTALLFFPAFDWAISPTHPEREERLLYTKDQIVEEGVLDLEELVEYTPREATEKEIARVHISVPDVQAQATEAHRVAAGGAITVADAWHRREVTNGFAIIRPPGHHAMRVVHGNRGFCNVHNEAVMVAHLRQTYGIRRVAIVDTDVHHGDGTQEIFYHDPGVLVIGLHQDGRTLYPGSGFIGELGGPGAFARNLNVPLPPGTGDEGLLYALENFVLPVLDEFQPELVINSAGQDNHYSDPLAMMRVSAQGYARLNERLAPDIAVLEGGYSIQSALPYVNLGIILAMAGQDYSHVREPDYDSEQLRTSEQELEVVRNIVNELQTVWEHPERVLRQLYPHLDGETYTREKRIYYDTDGILEEQVETVRLCEACPGWLRIDSRARSEQFGRRRIWSMSIPLYACSHCAGEGRERYKALVQEGGGAYNWVYLQDRPADFYQRYDPRTGEELVWS
jgi:acetoin utilization deacetylase AcuC-like enzyme